MLTNQSLRRKTVPTSHKVRHGLLATAVMTIFFTMGLTTSAHAALFFDNYSVATPQHLTGTFSWDPLGLDPQTVPASLHDEGTPLHPGTYDELTFSGPLSAMIMTATGDSGDWTFSAIAEFDGETLHYYAAESCQHVFGTDCSESSDGSFYTSPVPLPAAAWLFISALGGLFGVKRFSR